MPLEIPEVVVSRLPVYARGLASLLKQGREVVSSQELGDQLSVTPAQIRKDLSYFGRFGKQGRGYNVRRLAEELRQLYATRPSSSRKLAGSSAPGQLVPGRWYRGSSGPTPGGRWKVTVRSVFPCTKEESNQVGENTALT